MNRPDIEAIRKRCGFISRGPWKKSEEGLEFNAPLVILGENNKFIGEIMYWDDAEFIAHARTDIPVLLAYIEELESENRWIPVEERLPENDDPFVIVRTKTGEIIPGYLDTDLEDIPVLVHVNGIPILDAIAWRPLPYGVKNDAR